jgi:hypothetical protein
MGHFQKTFSDLEYVMIDSSSIRVHQDAARTHRGQIRDAMGRSRGGLTTKLHMACDALGYPLSFVLTCGEAPIRGHSVIIIIVMFRMFTHSLWVWLEVYE